MKICAKVKPIIVMGSSKKKTLMKLQEFLLAQVAPEKEIACSV